MGKRGLAQPRRPHLGSTVRALMEETGGMTMILQNGATLSFPLVVVYDETPLAEKSLNVAIKLIEDEESDVLTLLIAAEDKEGATASKRRRKPSQATWTSLSAIDS